MYLAYKNGYYKQTFETAIGPPVLVTVANLVMEDVEERAIASYHLPPLIWKRYVDEVCTALQCDKVLELLPEITFTILQQ